MLRLCGRALVKWGMGKPFCLVEPVSVTLVASRNLTKQNGPPKLPVPPLQQTCKHYLSLMELLVENNELKQIKALVEEFRKAGGIGERLQRCLERRACNTDNWLTEYYLRYMYLEERKPLVIFSNPGWLSPPTACKDKDTVQIRTAAKSLAVFLDMKTMIDNETLPVDYLKGKPLCMKQYEQLMSSCRIPGLKTDSLMFYSKSSNPPKHITVVHNCQFFRLDVYNNDGTPLTANQLSAQLERICKSSLQTNMEPVGILTSQHRDIWSKTYINLISDKTNKESVSAIQSSILTLCLDRALPAAPDEMYRSTRILQMLHGGGSQWNSGNRWFDKGLQIIVGEDGTCGGNACHAVADGTVIMSFADRHITQLKKAQIIQSSMDPLPMPKKLHFNITPEIKKDIEEAMQHIDKMVQSLDLRVAVFEHFGKNAIISHNISPDAFVQMALQLAYYRMHHQCHPTLEPVFLRLFRLGRVSSFNSSTSASATFVKAFDDPQKQFSEKVDLLKKAINVHRWHTKTAMNGQCSGLHLKALNMLAIEENISMPGIFTDTSFAKIFNYDVTTGQGLSKTGCTAVVGPEEDDKYIVVYTIMNDHIDLQVMYFDANKTNRESVAAHLLQNMRGALLDMRALLEQTKGKLIPT